MPLAYFDTGSDYELGIRCDLCGERITKDQFAAAACDYRPLFKNERAADIPPEQTELRFYHRECVHNAPPHFHWHHIPDTIAAMGKLARGDRALLRGL